MSAKVLFLGPGHQDYLSDGVFHGLRTLLGTSAVDFPKAEHLYASAGASVRGRLWGKGFTLAGLLEDPEVDRSFALHRALEREFDLVVFGDIWHEFGQWTEWGPRLARAGIAMAVLDGADSPAPYPYHWHWWRRPAWWFLPRAHRRAAYFKREITPLTRRFALGRTLGARPLSFSIPAEKVLAAPPAAKETDYQSHVVDPELAARLGAATGHAFETEADYYADLRRARFGVTTKRAGWDAMRHYEIAANGAVPAFRDLDRKPATCAPFGLGPANSISYRDADDLARQVTAIGEERYAELQAGALAWAHASTTEVRARELLAACGLEP